MYQKNFLFPNYAGSLPADIPRRKRSESRQGEVAITTDAELVLRILERDTAAETALYEKYSSRIYFLALSELHSRDDAEDIRAETFLRVIQALREGKLRKPESLASFIIGIALNIIREQNRVGAKTQALTDAEYEIPDAGSLESAFVDRDVRRSVEEATKALKPRERQFLRMYYFEEKSKAEIARALGIQEDRLRLIKSRTLKKFTEIYKKLTGS
ncbi:MAG: sigma-70 family RNA polymerase sigma factor [Acidobacteriota bacterium]